MIELTTRPDVVKWIGDNITKPTDARLVIASEMKLLKKSRVTGAPTPFNKIIAVKTVEARIGQSYRDAMMEAAAAVGTPLDTDYQPAARVWGESVPGNPWVIEHAGLYYINYIETGSNATEYEADGQKVEYSAIAEYVSLPTPASKEQLIKWRSIKFDSIIGLIIESRMRFLQL